MKDAAELTAALGANQPPAGGEHPFQGLRYRRIRKTLAVPDPEA